MKPSYQIACYDRILRLAKIGIHKANWYQVAQKEIETVCKLENWSVADFTNKLAILSPQVAIRRNVRLAYTYYGNGRYLANILPTVRLSMDNYEATGIVGGKKVARFAEALQGDPQAIVLDTWMSKALIREPGEKPSVKHFDRKATRKACEKILRSVARKLDISPCSAQACVWCGIYKETLGTNAQYFPILSEYDNWIAQDKAYPQVGPISVIDPYHYDIDEVCLQSQGELY